MSIKIKFIEDFSEEQAERIIEAAKEHNYYDEDSKNLGSDPFKWALLQCISYDCFENTGYRTHHRITVPFDDLKAWIIQYGDLGSHDGDFDALGLFSGKYSEFNIEKQTSKDIKNG